MLALVVKVSERELSDDVSPSLTSEAVMVMDGVPGIVVVVVVVVVVVATSTVFLNCFVIVGLFVEQFPASSHALTSIV